MDDLHGPTLKKEKKWSWIKSLGLALARDTLLLNAKVFFVGGQSGRLAGRQCGEGTRCKKTKKKKEN